jgi:pimeloyl-ACP methyl ester carboxylesterase
MPKVHVHDVELYYEETGSSAVPKRGAVVFAHGLLFDRRIFEHQVAALSESYRCIAFDFRGHGETEVTRGGYGMDTLADDAAALIEALGAAPCHFVGLSMGGFVGLRLASRRPELIRSLVLLDTSADPEPSENLPRYRLLNLVARLFGLRAVAGRVMPILFGRTTLAERRDLTALWRDRVAKQDRRGVTRAVIGVVERDGVADELARIRVPTLVLVGEEDTATTPEKSERLRHGIAGAELVTIPRAGHMSSLENPEAVTRALRDFLARTET